MAHIAVYLERTPYGLHPASAVSLCWARDIGSERGASVVAICSGEAATYDEGLARSAAAYGADVLQLSGPTALERAQERLRPVHVFVPLSPEGLAASHGLFGGPAQPYWLTQRSPPPSAAHAVTAIIAGCFPWHDLEGTLDPEYEHDVADVPLPPWLAADPTREGTFILAPLGDVYFWSADPPEVALAGRLNQAGAQAVEGASVGKLSGATLLMFPSKDGGLPPALAQRAPTLRTVVIAADDGVPDPSWASADWAFRGPWQAALRDLLGDSG